MNDTEAAATGDAGERGPFAAVAVDIAVADVNRVFHYRVPPGMKNRLDVGHRVLVPFGTRNVEGVVLSLSDTAPVDEGRIKSILRVEDDVPILTPAMIGLARWLAERTLSVQAHALRCLLPPGARRGRVRPLTRRVLRPADSVREDNLDEFTAAQRQVIRFLLDNPIGSFTRAELSRQAGVGATVLRTLFKHGHLIEEVEIKDRDPFRGTAPEPAAVPPTLTPHQEAAVGSVSEAVMEGRHEVFLLHGVTGSGKTEVYLRLIESVGDQGREAIVLVPEIALTPQLVRIFRSRFPSMVAVLHSNLSPGERHDEWLRIRRGEVRVVVGARSAVFAPFDKLGLIVVDEEHETTYKQDEAPRYHAREVAIERGRREDAPVLLGSATPSVESFHAARKGRYRLLTLPERIDGRSMPEVAVVDMRRELAEGNYTLFSTRLAVEVEGCLERGEQVILFLNRRGLRTFVLCRECGHVARCPRCDVSLTLHVAGGRENPAAKAPQPLLCHYCRHEEAPPVFCPVCGGRKIRYFGAGTQRVEEEARERFPGARILRMDRDTTARRGAHERIYEQFRRGEADIMIGTQMVAKGWDIAGVTLVGVVSADTALNLPDFRAGERTFQLLTQVGGRAGRGETPGRVIIQTYAPDHYSIKAAARHDYPAFFRHELRLRRALAFPPFSRLVRFVVSHHEEERAEALAKELAQAAVDLGAAASGENLLADEVAADGGRTSSGARLTGIEYMGPSPAPLARLHGRHRWQLAIRGRSRSALAGMARRMLADVDKSGDAVVAVDMDPVSML